MKLHPSERAFLEDLASTRDSWEAVAVRGLSDPAETAHWSEVQDRWYELSHALATPDARRAFAAVVRELLSGQAHSFLVALDGGSALAETTLLSVQDQHGHAFKRFLHEFWPEVGGEGDG